MKKKLRQTAILTFAATHSTVMTTATSTTLFWATQVDPHRIKDFSQDG